MNYFSRNNRLINRNIQEADVSAKDGASIFGETKAMRKHIFLWLIIPVFIMAGCGQGENYSDFEKTGGFESTQSSISYLRKQEAAKSRGSKQEKNEDNLSIPAEDTEEMPIDSDNIEIYTAELFIVCPGDLMKIFSAEPDVEEDEKGNIRLLNVYTGENGYINTSGSMGYYSKKGSKLMAFAVSARREINNGYADLNCVRRQEDIMQLFSEPDRFEFSSPEQIRSNILNVLTDLGIDECDLYFWPVSEELFTEYSAWYDENLNGAAKETVEDPFGDYEEFYFVKAVQRINEIPLLDETGFMLSEVLETKNDSTESETLSVIQGTNIYLICTGSGIEGLEIFPAYDRFLSTGKSEKIISADEAEALLDEKLQALLIYEPAEVVAKELIYIPVPVSETGEPAYRLIPYWRLSCDTGEQYYFNAATGKELV